LETSSAGVIQPFRTASARAGLSLRLPRASWGGVSSAITWPCSVIRNVSPPFARLTYAVT